MGCTQTKGAGASSASADVDKQLADAAQADQNHYKILLLGAGESGKSTVLKQVKMIFKGHIDEKEREEFVISIRRNAVECMQVILEAMTTLGIGLRLPENAPLMQKVLGMGEDVPFTPKVANYIATLWADPGVREAYGKRNKFWLLDAASYYFDEVLRLAETDYVPTDEDIILTRVRTTGIDTTQFSEPPYTYSVVDVGGQRNERRKWIHCFDNVKAVVFLAGLSGYSQPLFEDSTQNKMEESLKLFKQVVANPLFRETPVFLFLNKKDLFETMIRSFPLRTCFPEYEGKESDVHEALRFVEGKFRGIVQASCPNKKLFVHVVAARLRMDMKVAWGDVKEQLKAIYSRKDSKVWGVHHVHIKA
ncbi:unnamed protein product [Choristocarpus tenellus]